MFGMRSQERRATALYIYRKQRRQMKTNNIATERDRAFAAATRNALMSGVVISDMLDPLSAIHKALNAKHASGELTDGQYSEKARELLEMFRRFDGIMTELVTDRPR